MGKTIKNMMNPIVYCEVTQVKTYKVIWFSKSNHTT